MMPILYKDIKAVEGIPLKLIIIVLILAIALPLIWTGLENYDRTQKENDLRNEIEYIITTIKFVYTSGENNSQLIDVNFESGFTTKVERVEIGDEKAGLWSTIRYKLNNRPEVTIIINNPDIPVANKTAHGLDALIIGEGMHKLLFTARSDHDLDDDGFNDLYVEVSSVK
jgi:hypothetical protein